MERGEEYKGIIEIETVVHLRESGKALLQRQPIQSNGDNASRTLSTTS